MQTMIENEIRLNQPRYTVYKRWAPFSLGEINDLAQGFPTFWAGGLNFQLLTFGGPNFFCRIAWRAKKCPSRRADDNFSSFLIFP
jgi:hypothetical protein